MGRQVVHRCPLARLRSSRAIGLLGGMLDCPEAVPMPIRQAVPVIGTRVIGLDIRELLSGFRAIVSAYGPAESSATASRFCFWSCKARSSNNLLFKLDGDATRRRRLPA